MELNIKNKHPVISEKWPIFIFLNAAYDGKNSWFKDYPSSLNTKGNSLMIDLELAQCFLPLEETEELPEFRNRYYRRLRRSRWKPLLKETIKLFSGILSNYVVTDPTFSWLKEERKKEYLNNIDLEGKDHYTFFAECDKLALLEGWCAVWVNSSKVEEQPSNYIEQQDLNYRPYLQIIKRSQIINFETIRLKNGQKKLTKLVYEEEIYEEEEKMKKYVEIAIGKVTVYQETKSSENKNQTELKQIEESEYDLDNIPIVFYPINSVSPFDADFPFLEIAEDNRSHYQIYSDYRESLHYNSLPILTRIGLIEPGQDPTSLPPVMISPYAVVDLPEGGDLKIVETSGTAINLNKESLEKIENEIIKKSLNFVETSTSRMTATEAKLRSIQFQSSFDVYANSKSSAITEIFNLFGEWVGINPIGQGIILNDAIFKMASPELMRFFKELTSEGFLDIETFWKILDYWGTLPKGVNLNEILEAINGIVRENQAPRDSLES